MRASSFGLGMLLLSGASIGACGDDAPSASGGAGATAATSGAGATAGGAGGSGGGGGGGQAGLPADWWLELDGAIGTPLPTAQGAIPDGSGHGIDGTAARGLVFVEGHPLPVTGAAFPGDGAAIVVEDAAVAGLADLAADESLTLEVGFRTDAHGQDGEAGEALLLGRDQGFALSIVGGRLVLSLAAAGAETAPVLTLDEPRVADGRWHRVIATRDGDADEVRVVLDGAVVASAADPTAGKAIGGEGVLRVGAREGGTAALLGEIDRVALRRKAVGAPQVAEVPARVPVFRGGVDVGPGGGAYTSIRIPAIVRATDGSLLAVAEGRVDDQCDFGDIDIVAKRSTDHGKAWSELYRVANHGTGKVGNPVPIVDEVSGRIVLLSTTTDIQGGACSDPVGGSARVQVQHSDDHGLTWSDPVDVTDQVLDADWNGVGLLGPAHGIQVRHGPSAGALLLHAMHRRDSDNARGGHLLVSHDGGASWAIAAKENESAPAVEVNEGTVAELGGGRLWVNVRHQTGDPAPEWTKGLRGQAFVTPELGWESSPPFARMATFRGPVVHGSTFRWWGSDRWGDEARTFFSYPAGQYGTNFGQRHDLRLHASHDDAQTFAPGTRVYGGKASYSDVVALDDAHLGVLHETADDDQDFNTRIDLRAFGVQALDDATVLGWTFEDGAVGEAVGSTALPGPVALDAEGVVQRVAGRHHSAAARFDGSRLCASVAGLEHRADAGIRDGFEVEVSFRTDSHADGGAAASGALVARTAVGTAAAWWLRIEDGRVRFAVGDETGKLDIVQSAGGLADGAWHTVRARRDPAKKALSLTVDGGEPTTAPTTTTGHATNGERLCVGAFAGAEIPRPFHGDIDAVAMRLTQ